MESYLKQKVDSWEIYTKKIETTILEFKGKNTDFVSSGVTNGIGIRVHEKGRVGFSYTDNIADFRRCADEAIRICRLNKPDAQFERFAIPQKYKKINPLNKGLMNMTNDDVNRYFREYLANLNEVDKRIESGSSTYKKVFSEKHILNSEGVDFTEGYANNTVYFDSLKITTPGETVTLSVGDIDNKPLDAGKAAGYAERLKSLLAKKQPKSDKMQFLLHPDAFGEILHGFMNSSITAESIREKRSVFENKLGAEVFNRSITITDSGIAPGLLRTRSCDDEGIPCRETEIMKNGALKNFIYDTYHAYKEGKKSTGNAWRSEFSPPGISTSNLIVSPGKEKGLLDRIDKGIYIKDLLGIHTMNMNTGDFSLGIYEGHYVEDGEIQYPVRDTMVAGNFLMLMKNVESLGKELIHSFNHGSGGVYAPEVLFPEVQVIGQ